jgi:hypothetical protein
MVLKTGPVKELEKGVVIGYAVGPVIEPTMS